MVELEAKSSVFNQALESSQEAIESFDKMKIDESSLDPTTRAVLDNLKDRKMETESEWQKLQKNVNEQKNKIYKKLDGLSKVFWSLNFDAWFFSNRRIVQMKIVFQPRGF